MKKFYAIPWVICFLFFQNITIHSQTSITGKVTDKETGEDMISANIVISENGVFIQGETTDIDGNYSIQVGAGEYDLEISYTGYATQNINGIVAIDGQATKLDVQIKSGSEVLWIGGCGGYIVPLIRHDETSPQLKVTSEKIRNLPARNINEIISITPGVSFAQ